MIEPAQVADALGMHRPTDEQAAVIAGPMEPTLVVAGAGAGKTETMAARVVWLVANGLVRPEQVLGLTFTRKAAQQLSRRIRARLAALARSPLCTGPGSDPTIAEAIRTTDPQISTYHSYAGSLLSSYGLLVPVEPDATLLSETAVFQLAHDVVSRWETPLTTTTTNPGRITGDVLDLAGQLSEHLVTTDELRAHPDGISTLVATLPSGPRQSDEPTKWLREVLAVQQLRDELADLVDAVTARLRAESALDHSSRMSLAAALARDFPHVGQQERAAAQVVLLDEYQDTGYSQRVMLSSLFGGGATPHPAVTAVGDPMQSIYGWRGASASNLDRFRTDFPRPDGSEAHVLELTTSWRNPTTVLHLANQVSAPLRDSPSAVPVPELRAKPGAPDGDVQVAVFDTVVQERQWLAATVADQYRAIERQGRQPTAAVLVRRNADSVPLAEQLRAHGVPVEIVGVGGLLDIPEITDIVSLLTVVARPAAGTHLLRLLTGSRFALEPVDLAALAARAQMLSLRPTPAGHEGEVTSAEDLDALVVAIASSEDVDSAGLADALADPGPADHFSPDGYRRITELAAIIHRLRRRADAPPARLVAAAEHALGLDVEVRVRERVDGGDGREHLDALLAVAANFGTGVTAGLEAFIDHLELARNVERGLTPGEAIARPGRVQILTVHSAKGLEWEIVAIPHIDAEVFPSKRPPANALRTASQIPDALRGDRADDVNPGGAPVPNLDDVVDRKQLEATLKSHIKKVGQRSLDEDRRLFYVAVTRSEHTLLLSSSHWSGTRKTAKGPSVFLDDILTQHEVSHTADGSQLITVAHTCDTPSPENPLVGETIHARWPRAAAAGNRSAAAEMVNTSAPVDPIADADTAGSTRTSAVTQRRLHEAAALLAERRDLAKNPQRLELPRRLSTSEVVALDSDPDAFAARLRRPLPFKPDRFARRGTRFHAWLEHRFGATHLLDLDELPGAGDDQLDDDNLEDLQRAFESSRWAHVTPESVEVPFEVALGRHLLRGRMDAVFADGDGWVVVDWKTGRVPAPAEMSSVAMQLAVYRYAWSRIISARTGREVPLGQVRAVFHYVRSNHTVEPPDLPDAQQLQELLAAGANSDRD